MLVLAGANRRDHREWRYVIDDKWLTEVEAKRVGLKSEQLELRRREVGDGLLTAYEVMALDLNGTELVVLATCETGLGVSQGTQSTGMKQPTGESVAGLRQAFSIAGARSVVMSIWSVPLDQTVKQMETFLNAWLSRGTGRYSAFRESQLSALATARQHAGNGHPFWWAGFLYIGDPDDRR